MFADNHRDVFTGTPSTPGTGWFMREGQEFPKHGVFTEGKHVGKPYTLYTPPCSRCGGLGGSDKWGPGGSDTGWTCFECQGAKCGLARKVRLYTAEELAVLNERREAQRAKKLAARQAEAARIKAEQEASAAARKTALEADPFYTAFRDLVATFNPYTARDPEWDALDTRRPLPDFLRDMWKRIQHTDLSDKMRAAVQKFLDARAAEQRRRDVARFLGKEGDRLSIHATVLFVKTIHYGTNRFYDPSKYLIKFETIDGLVLTWFTEKYFEKGTTVIGKATVKAHKEYNGQKETQITNFRIAEKIAPGKEVEMGELPMETIVTPTKGKSGKLDPHDRRACLCGSCLPKRELRDARGISCGYVCDACEADVRATYRPEIFTNSQYWTDEPVNAGDSYGAP